MKRTHTPFLRSALGKSLAAALLGLSTMLSGCGTTNSGGLLDSALGMVGLQRPPAPEQAIAAAEKLASRPARVAMRLHAGQTLNSDADNQSLSVVARVYKLKDKAAFLQAPRSVFIESRASAFPQLAADIVEVREIVLTPNQRYEVIETVPPEAPYIGVVALFRAPDEQRWRFVFDTKASATAGITLGLHGCAISVASGQALDTPPENTRLAGARCR